MSKPSWYLGDVPSAKRPPRVGLTRNPSGATSRLNTIAPHRVNGSLGVMSGYPSVTSQWTEVASAREGHFLEQIAPGSFRDAVRNPAAVKIMFQHGRDPFLGERPLGKVNVLREDSHGLYYEVDLVPTAGNRELLPLLENGLLGASFRFTVLDERYDPKPARSAYNPTGIPERTVTHVRLLEAGPVVFGQYEGATSGIKQPVSSIDLAGNSTGSVAASKQPRRTTARPSWYLPDTPPPRRKSYLTKASPYL